MPPAKRFFIASSTRCRTRRLSWWCRARVCLAIIGAQTLIDAKVPNRVAYLEDGTAGWTRASLELASGRSERTPATEEATRFGARHADTLVQRSAMRTASQATVSEWLANTGDRTTYLLDVRSAEEYAAGHLPGAISSPSGQLLAVSHRTVATRGARMVLTDDDGTRALTTAYWLQQRGWEVHLLEHAPIPTTGGLAAALAQ